MTAEDGKEKQAESWLCSRSSLCLGSKKMGAWFQDSVLDLYYEYCGISQDPRRKQLTHSGWFFEQSLRKKLFTMVGVGLKEKNRG